MASTPNPGTSFGYVRIIVRRPWITHHINAQAPGPYPVPALWICESYVYLMGPFSFFLFYSVWVLALRQSQTARPSDPG